MAVQEEILEYIQKNGKATPIELIKKLNVSQSSIFKNLSELVSNGQLVKHGQNRSTFYTLPTQAAAQEPVAKPQVKAPPPPSQDVLKTAVPPETDTQERAQVIKEIEQSFSNTAQEMLGKTINPQSNWNLRTLIKSVMKLLESLGLRFWVLLVLVAGYLLFSVANYFWSNSQEKKINQQATQEQNIQLQALLARQEQRQIQLEEQIKSLQQAQAKQKQMPSSVPVAAATTEPKRESKKEEALPKVDYNELIEHPVRNANNTVNFFKRHFGRETKASEPSPKELPKQSVIQEIASPSQDMQELKVKLEAAVKEQLTLKEQLKAAHDKIDELSQQNRRLSHQYQNEVSINLQLERKLQSALAQKASVSTVKDFSFRFDENGDRVK